MTIKLATYLSIITLSTLTLGLQSVHAETVTTKTEVKQIDLPQTQKIDFMSFDNNKDGALSKAEVGSAIFKMFDPDGNAVIDNLEFDKKVIMTSIPMKEDVVVTTDFNDDGSPDDTSTSSREFMEMSKLAMFDENRDGLSAHDFLDTAMRKYDLNHDNLLDSMEWKRAYAERVTPLNSVNSRYNN